MKNLKNYLLLALLILGASSISAYAGEPGRTAGISSSKSTANLARTPSGKDAPVILRQSTLQVLKFDEDIGSIVLTDPRPVELIVENSRRIVMRPVQPGVTSLTVIGKSGAVIYKREVVVTNRGEDYVRVTRYCDGGACDEEDIYYCPYGCYGVQSLSESDNAYTTGGTAVTTTQGEGQ